ncbi:MAG: glycerophosphodiester phosphodiesterase family protein [Pseudomonadota bacterium]
MSNRFKCASAVAGLCLSLVASPVSADACAADGITLLSYNVRVDKDGASWPRRRAGVKNTLERSNGDLILFQEASEFMIADYRRMLPGFHYVVGERSDGHRDPDGWYEYLPVFYDPARFEMLDNGSFWVADDPDEPGGTLSGSKPGGRVLTWVELRDRCSDAAFLAANVHIHGEASERAVRLLLRRLRQQAPMLPLVLAGDFNVTPDSQTYRLITSELDLADARAMAEEVTGGEATFIGAGERVPEGVNSYKAGHTARRLDYVFTDAMQIESYSVRKTPIARDTFASDHFPVVVELSPGQTPGPATALFQGAPGYVAVVAHRGCWQEAPENSYAAIDRCISLGVDMVEIDVRRTRDGHLAVIHDATLDRTTGARGRVEDRMLGEISQLRLKLRNGGSGSALSDQRIPELTELLRHYRGRIAFNLDVKDAFAYAATFAAVRAIGMLDEVLIKHVATPHDRRLLRMSQVPGVRLMPVVHESMGSLLELAGAYESLNLVAYELVFQSVAYLDSIAELSRRSERPLWVNTLKPSLSAGFYDGRASHDPDEVWGRLVRAGVDIIQTDRPAELIEYLDSKGWRNAHSD